MRHKNILLGLIALMLSVSPAIASAATSTSNTTVSATLSDVLTLTTPATVTLTITPTTGGSLTSASDTVTITSNVANGYNLTVRDTDTNNALVNGVNTIPAHSGTAAAPTALAPDTWGFAVAGAPFDTSYAVETNATTSTSRWAGMPASNGTPATLRSTSAIANAEVTTVWYAARVTSAKPNGTYSASITYTATTK